MSAISSRAAGLRSVNDSATAKELDSIVLAAVAMGHYGAARTLRWILCDEPRTLSLRQRDELLRLAKGAECALAIHWLENEAPIRPNLWERLIVRTQKAESEPVSAVHDAGTPGATRASTLPTRSTKPAH